MTKREMDRFDKMRVCDLKTLLIEHAKSQADFHRKMQVCFSLSRYAAAT